VFQRDWSTPFRAVTRPRPSRDTARAMSQEDVEVVRRVYKLAEAQGVEGLLELATDDIEPSSLAAFRFGSRIRGVPANADKPSNPF
jgi:hypothetical protein